MAWLFWLLTLSLLAGSSAEAGDGTIRGSGGTEGYPELNTALDLDGDGVDETIYITPDYDGNPAGDTTLDLDAALGTITGTLERRAKMVITPGDYHCPDDIPQSKDGCFLVDDQEYLDIECQTGAVIHGNDLSVTSSENHRFVMVIKNSQHVTSRGCEIDGGAPRGWFGTVTAVPTTTEITDDSADWGVNQWDLPTYGDQLILRPAGPNREVIAITSNTSDTLTIETAPAVAAQVGEEFYIGYLASDVPSGIGPIGLEVNGGHHIKVDEFEIHDTFHACTYEKAVDDLEIRNTNHYICGRFFQTTTSFRQPCHYSFWEGAAASGDDTYRNKLTSNRYFACHANAINSRSDTQDFYGYDYEISDNSIYMKAAASGSIGTGIQCSGFKRGRFISNRVVGGQNGFGSTSDCQQPTIQNMMVSEVNGSGISIQDAHGATVIDPHVRDIGNAGIIVNNPVRDLSIQGGKIEGTNGAGIVFNTGTWDDDDGPWEINGTRIINVGWRSSDPTPSDGRGLDAIDLRGFVGDVSQGTIKNVVIRGLSGSGIRFGGNATNIDIVNTTINPVPTPYGGVTTVASLPTCDSSTLGHYYFVTDHLSGTTCTTGGTTEAGCFCNLSGAWELHDLFNPQLIRFEGAANDSVRIINPRLRSCNNSWGILLNGGIGSFTNSQLLYGMVDDNRTGLTSLTCNGLIDMNGVANSAAEMNVVTPLCVGTDGNCVEP